LLVARVAAHEPLLMTRCPQLTRPELALPNGLIAVVRW
jgi:hypothetical protein